MSSVGNEPGKYTNPDLVLHSNSDSTAQLTSGQRIEYAEEENILQDPLRSHDSRAMAMLLCAVCPTFVKKGHDELSRRVSSSVVNAKKSSCSLPLLPRGQNYLSARLSLASPVLCHGQASGVGGRHGARSESIHKRQTQSIAGPTPVSTKVNKVYPRLLLKNH